MGLIAEWKFLFAVGKNARYALAISIVFTCFSAAVSRGVLITFSDLDGTPGPMLRGGVDGTTYGAAQGMPDGITGTFVGFDEYSNTSPNPLDHDHTNDADGNWRAIYGVSDPNTEGDPAYLNFSGPVQISSLWFDNSAGNWPAEDGSPAYDIEVGGLLDGSAIWTYSYPFSQADDDAGYVVNDVFLQITSGANLTVNQLEFINVEDVAIDDITINTVPEPSCLGLLGLISAGLFMQRRSRVSVK